MRLMLEAALRHPRVLASPEPAAFITELADSGINLELGFWVADPEAGTLGVRSAISLAVWKAFKEAGIEIPFPQRLIHPDVEIQGAGHGLSRLPGAQQVAAIQGGGLAAQKSPRQRTGLRHAFRIERPVDMALHTLFDIPVRLAVANETNPGDFQHLYPFRKTIHNNGLNKHNRASRCLHPCLKETICAIIPALFCGQNKIPLRKS